MDKNTTAKDTAAALLDDASTPEQAKKKEIPIICQRIRYFREKRGMEQKTFAARLGIISNAVSNWETGRSQPTVQTLPKICEILEINVNQLFDMPVYSTPKPDTKPAIVKSSKKRAEEDIFLEKFSRLNAGHRIAVEALMDKLCDAEDEAIYNSILETTLAKDQLCAGYSPGTEIAGIGEPFHVYANMVHSDMDCIFSISGDSMEPEFHDGDMVMVQRLHDSSELNIGEIGAFACGNDAYIKVYSKAGLRSLNKKYKMIRFHEDDQVMLIGRVLGILNPNAIVSFEDMVRYEKAEKRIKEREKQEN